MRARFRMLLLAFLLVGSSASAQDEDLLVPLTAPTDTKPKPKKKTKKPPRSSDADGAPASPPQLVVTLPTDLSGARLYVDGVDAGLLPGRPVAAKPGAHRVVVRRLGFREYSSSVTVKPEGNTWLAVKLEPRAGVLNVQADALEAEVLVDGQRAGSTPIASMVLPPGTHDVVVSKRGYTSETSRLLVRAGKDYTLRAHLKPSSSASASNSGSAADVPLATVSRGGSTPSGAVLTPASLNESLAPVSIVDASSVSAQPWYSRWYVWAGVGAVVAGGVTAAILTSHPKALSPNAVCGGACDGTINAPSALIHF